MFKVQFRTRKPIEEYGHYVDPYQDYEYPEGIDEHYRDNQFHQSTQAHDLCVFCGDLITNGHLAVITNKGEYCMHTSCIVSGLALVLNATGLLINVLFKKRKE